MLSCDDQVHCVMVLLGTHTARRESVRVRVGGLLSARSFPLELPQEVLRADEMVVENAARDVKQVAQERVAKGVIDVRAKLSGGHDVLGPENGKLLRDQRLFKAQFLLELADGPFASDQHLENPDADWVSQGTKELGLERLETIRHGSHRSSSYGRRPQAASEMAIWPTCGPSSDVWHDGATLIEGDQIIRVGAILPLARTASLPRAWGTRHRAARRNGFGRAV
jgi:hypothetical protein